MPEKSIANAELEVMRLLWRSSPMTLAQIRGALLQTTKWNHSTIKTLVFRLRDKGVIKPLDKYGPAQYVPLVSEREYIQAQVPPFLERVFEGSAKKLAAALVDSGELSESDVDELKAYFKVKGGGGR
ncbi:MAG: BlaI/MecI/CopY family transcriptional regulator [Clostridiales Family XIII bacterium]|jgi:BlaI family penicillinase repressor|nr:BlaI/MecI/CopY family transcriptional regulator [Clostridiales Family XIII bacterium]